MMPLLHPTMICLGIGLCPHDQRRPLLGDQIFLTCAPPPRLNFFQPIAEIRFHFHTWLL